MEFVTLTNDVVELSGVVNLTSEDVTLDTDGQDRSFNITDFLTLIFLTSLSQLPLHVHLSNFNYLSITLV